MFISIDCRHSSTTILTYTRILISSVEFLFVPPSGSRFALSPSRRPYVNTKTSIGPFISESKHKRFCTWGRTTHTHATTLFACSSCYSVTSTHMRFFHVYRQTKWSCRFVMSTRDFCSFLVKIFVFVWVFAYPIIFNRW